MRLVLRPLRLCGERIFGYSGVVLVGERLEDQQLIPVEQHGPGAVQGPDHRVGVLHVASHDELCLFESNLDHPGLIPEITRSCPANRSAAFSDAVPGTLYRAFVS